MNDAVMATEEQVKLLKLAIPFETEEGARFREFLAVRGAKAGPFVRQLLLTAMDSAAGPIVEAAMRGRSVPDLGAGQARELAEALEARR